jgi:hypothetical protein
MGLRHALLKRVKTNGPKTKDENTRNWQQPAHIQIPIQALIVAGMMRLHQTRN